MLIHTRQLKHLGKVMSPALSHSAKLTERREEKAAETIDSGPGATALRPIQPRAGSDRGNNDRVKDTPRSTREAAMRFRLCGASYSEAFHTRFLLFPQRACLMGRAGDEMLLSLTN